MCQNISQVELAYCFFLLVTYGSGLLIDLCFH